uniref:ADP ribosylation factor like GTPase 5B n=5 Tax=Neognathae TaxID=8825 RepID=A0A8V0XR99_CHICK
THLTQRCRQSHHFSVLYSIGKKTFTANRPSGRSEERARPTHLGAEDLLHSGLTGPHRTATTCGGVRDDARSDASQQPRGSWGGPRPGAGPPSCPPLQPPARRSWVASARGRRHHRCSRSCLSGFRVPREHKVIIVGLDNAGKTTILYQFLMNEVVHTSPTIGSNVEEIVVKNTHFLMWDIGGQESLRSSWNTYYSNTEFIILVVDSIDRERLSITKEELYRMLAHEDLRKAAVLIFANKQDMKGCMTAAEISAYLTLSSIKDHPWHIQSCCALTGEGLCQGLEWMTSRIGVR